MIGDRLVNHYGERARQSPWRTAQHGRRISLPTAVAWSGDFVVVVDGVTLLDPSAEKHAANWILEPRGTRN